jgi:hypothetical protein
MTSIKNWLPIYAMAGLTLALAPAVHSEEGGSEPEAYELLEPAGPVFWEQLSPEQQLAELERHDRDGMVRQAYVFVDLTPLAEADPGEPVRVSLQPFHDFVVESDLVEGERYPGTTIRTWHVPRGSKSWVYIATGSSLAPPYRRGLGDHDRLVKVSVKHNGAVLSSHEVPGAPNVLCIEEVLFDLHEPDEMNNSPEADP